MKITQGIRRSSFLIALSWVLALAGCYSGLAGSSQAQASRRTTRPSAASEPSDATQLTIDTQSLPVIYPQAPYSVRLRRRGGIAPYRWHLEAGDLPPGLKLESNGTLHGAAQKPGEYRLTISVTDSTRQAVQREYVLRVLTALSLQWKIPAHVTGNRIEGSVAVSNTTQDDFDFTFVALAVNENGRATALGYQRFPLKKGTTDFEIPFGETLPHGAYMIHVDGVAELPQKNQIHRSRLQTPAALQVVVGP